MGSVADWLQSLAKPSPCWVWHFGRRVSLSALASVSRHRGVITRSRQRSDASSAAKQMSEKTLSSDNLQTKPGPNASMRRLSRAQKLQWESYCLKLLLRNHMFLILNVSVVGKLNQKFPPTDQRVFRSITHRRIHCCRELSGPLFISLL